MTRDEAMRAIAALHTEWSLRYGDVVPYNPADSAPHPGARSDYAAHQADRSADPAIDDPLNQQIRAVLSQIDDVPAAGGPTIASMTYGPKSQCGYCTRLRSPWEDATAPGVMGPWCAAFPQGVPEVIWTNQFDHRNEYDGDHGLRWEALPGATYPKPDFPTATVAAADPGEQAAQTGCMIALIPAADWVGKLRLDELEGALPADDVHLTVAYLGDLDTIPDVKTIMQAATAAARDVAALLRPVQAEAFGVALINPVGDQPCIALLCSGDDLDAAYSAVCGMLHMDGVDLSESKRPWLAHITLAYTDDQYAAADVTDRCGPLTFDRIRVAFGPDVTDLPLAGDTGIHDQPQPPAG